ncbi:MAG: sigma-70 family RNA polymerase sigma factor [Defluviitaleaceae bacterium]|nr:sigma-70 family RNA polymerase sigma factor [Defluviitaleaceae bacterium]
MPEQNTFEFVYEKYKRLMWTKAYDILKDYALAEDAVSEAFIRVYRNFHRIQDPAAPQTAAFLVTIVKNTAINIYHKRNKMLPTDFDEFERADSYNMEEDVATRDEAERATALVDRLGESERSVFLLKYAHDMAHKDIGKMLGISENNVNVRLHRAKKKLADMAKEVRP